MYLIRERFFRLGEDSDITDEHGSGPPNRARPPKAELAPA